jgi:LSD1 subclass zinc finger protein
MSGRPLLLASLLGLLAAEDGPLTAKRMKATQGKLEPVAGGRLRIEDPKVRAVVSTSEGPKTQALVLPVRAETRVAELRFTYLGATREQKPLRSGELRRQVKEPMTERTSRVDWAELPRRTFDFDVFACVRCGGRRRVLAYVKGARGVRAILEHLGLPTACASLAPARGPPQAAWC